MTLADPTSAFFDGLLRAPFATTALVAWGILLLRAAVGVRTIAREDRRLGAWLLALAAVALAARLIVPWGPLNFAETERLAALWGEGFHVDPLFAAVGSLQALLRWLGLDVGALYRFGGPAFGTIGVVLTAVAARNLGLSRSASLVAAAVVAAWPAHIRYSACGGMSVPGATLWTAVFVLALPARRTAALQPLALAAAVALAIQCRPEYRLLVVGVAPLAFAGALSRRSRLGALAATALLLLPYVPHLAPEAGRVSESTLALVRAHPLEMATQLLLEQPLALLYRDLLAAPRVAPAWWVVAGLSGLLVGRAPRAARLAIAGLVATQLAVCAAFGNEQNPLFDQWRYLVLTVPFFGLGVGLLTDRLRDRLPDPLSDRYRGGRGAALLVAVPLVAGLIHLPILRLETDLQREYQWLTEHLPRHIAAKDTVLTLASRPLPSCVVCTPALAAASAGVPSATHLPWFDGAARPTAGAAVVFRGLAWAGPALPGYLLTPLVESEHDVPAGAPEYDLQCPTPRHTFVGPGLRPCHLSLGLYRLEAP